MAQPNNSYLRCIVLITSFWALIMSTISTNSEEYAFVTLAVIPSEKNDTSRKTKPSDFEIKCLVPILHHSYISIANGTYKFVVLSINSSIKIKNNWESLGMTIFEPNTSQIDAAMGQQRHYWASVTYKSLALSLTNYTKVMFIDADTFFNRKLDRKKIRNQYFNNYSKHSLTGYSQGKSSPLNAGAMLLRPSEIDVTKIIEIMKIPWTKAGGRCNCSIPKWTGLKDWNFIGSKYDQGILFQYFGVQQNSFRRDQNILRNFGVTHLTSKNGEFKPWRMNVALLNTTKGLVAQRGKVGMSDAICWFAIYADFLSNVTRANAYESDCRQSIDVLVNTARNKFCSSRKVLKNGNKEMKKCCMKLRKLGPL